MSLKNKGNGSALYAFWKTVPAQNINEAEVQAMSTGVQFCINHGFRVESDSVYATNVFLLKGSNPDITHTQREKNRVADLLAERTHQLAGMEALNYRRLVQKLRNACSKIELDYARTENRND